MQLRAKLCIIIHIISMPSIGGKYVLAYDVQKSALWRSAQRGDLDDLRKRLVEMIEVDSEPRAIQKALNCALQIAVWNEHTDAVALILDGGADPNARIRDDCSLFTKTCLQQNDLLASAIRRLLQPRRIF